MFGRLRLPKSELWSGEDALKNNIHASSPVLRLLKRATYGKPCRESTVDPLPLPDAFDLYPFRHSLRKRLNKNSSISASACADNECEGKLKIKRSVKRYSAEPSINRETQRDEESPDTSRENNVQHKRRWRFEYRSSSVNSTVSLQLSDTEYGSAKITLDPSEKFSTCIRFGKDIFPGLDWEVRTLPEKHGVSGFVHRCLRDLKISICGDDNRMEFLQEMKWNKRSLSVFHSVRALHYMASIQMDSKPFRLKPTFQFPLWAGGSIRIHNFPLKLTPTINVPLWNGSREFPYFTWTRESKGGLGEIGLIREPVQIHYDFPMRRVEFSHHSRDSAVSTCSLDAQGVVKLEQSLTKMYNDIQFTFTSLFSTQAEDRRITLEADAPWGILKASRQSCGSFSLSMDSKFPIARKCHLRAMVKSESLDGIALRFGVFY